MSNTQTPFAYPTAGDVIAGKYRIDRLLGEGGMGAVARATHLITRIPVALKFMNPGFMRIEGAVERFLKEGEAAGRIRSDHVVQIFDVDKLPQGAPYIAMECLAGHDLQQIVEAEGASGLPIDRAVHFTVQILRGLQAAHAVGIVHRDMKPSNCFAITRDGEPDFVKLLDFGISKVSQPGQESLTRTNSALGTPLYMAPEQASSPRGVDHRCDLYSVGVILYELLTGGTPFTSESGELTEILFKLFTAEVPKIRDKRPEIPEGLATVVHAALARDPKDRIPSALAFAEALEPFSGPHTKPFITKMRGYVAPVLSEDAFAHTAPIEAFKQLEARMHTVPVPGQDTQMEPSSGGGTLALDKTGLQVDIPPASKVPVLVNDTQVLAGGQAKRTAALSSRPPLTPMSVATPISEAVAQPPRSSRNVYIAFVAVLVLSAAGTAGVITLRGDKTQGGGAGSATSLPSALPTTPATSVAVLPTVATTAPLAAETPTVVPSASASGRKIPGVASSAKVTPTARPTSSAGLHEGIQ